MFDIFRNGNKMVNRRLMVMEYACAALITIISLVLGFLPSQDWMPKIAVQVSAFVLMVVQVTLKGVEMFFNKTAAIYAQDDSHPTPQKATAETTAIQQ